MTAAATLAVLVAVTACNGDGRVPSTLFDGSRTRRLPVQLEGVSGAAVLTRARVVDALRATGVSAVSACMRAWRPVAATHAVARVGVAGASVTLVDRDRQALYGCDDSSGVREANRRWCGLAFTTLFRGRPRDPRLGIGCVNHDGRALAFAWVSPARGTAFVAVRQPGYAEVYPAVSGAPVRVAAVSAVDLDRSAARIEVSEHDPAGRRLRSYELALSVAG